MGQIETNLVVQFSCFPIRKNLPERIVGADATLTFLPKTRPARKIQVDPTHVRHGLRSQRFLDQRAVVGASEHPNVMETGCLLDVVPPDARLGTLAGLARVRRNENSQRAIALSHLLRCVHHLVAETGQVCTSSLPVEFLLDALATRLSERRKVRLICCKAFEGSRDIRCCLLRIDCGNLDACGFGNSQCRAAEIEANHGPSRSHRLKSYPAAGVMQTGKKQHVAGRQFLKNTIPRKEAPEDDFVMDSQLTRQPLQ